VTACGRSMSSSRRSNKTDKNPTRPEPSGSESLGGLKFPRYPIPRTRSCRTSANAPWSFTTRSITKGTFYWNSMAPDAPPRPSGALAEAINRDFGSVDAMRRELAEVAKGEFGSGRAWLVKDREGGLQVWSTHLMRTQGNVAERPSSYIRGAVRPGAGKPGVAPQSSTCMDPGHWWPSLHDDTSVLRPRLPGAVCRSLRS
jgi:hypothetical protein